MIAIEPVGDKVTRLYANQPQFEAGAVILPREAPWLQELIVELMAFPNYRHDDQVDSISQALTWIKRRPKPISIGVVSIPNYNYISLRTGEHVGEY